MDPATAKIVSQVLSGSISLLVTYMGVEKALGMLDQIRQKMVDEQRGPEPEEVDALFGRIEGRSERIQNS